MTAAASVTRNAEGSMLMAEWRGLANGDAGEALGFAEWADRSVQVIGTFGSGGALQWEGSNDGENFVPMRDCHGDVMSFTAAGLKTVLDIARLCRPRVSAGDGTTSLCVHVLCRRGRAAPRVVTDQEFRST